MKTKCCLAAIVIGLAVLLSSYANAQSPSFQWAKRVASTTNDDDELAIGLAIDSAANLYVTGWFDGTNDFGNGVRLTNSPGGGQDIFVAKYDPAGVVQWARRAGSDTPPGPHDEGLDAGRGIGLDSAGNVYVTGEFFGNADFDGLTVTALTNKEFFLAKYDASGSVQWVRQSLGGNPMIGPGWSDGVYGTGLAVDGAGNSYAVGFAANVTANGTLIRFGTNTLDNLDSDGGSTFLVKYDTAGNAHWAKSCNSPLSCYSTAVTLDDGGNVYAGGGFRNLVRIGGTEFTSTGAKDAYVAKFNSAGAFQWARQMTGPSDASALGLAPANASGGLYVAGAFGTTGGDIMCFNSSICLTNIGSGLPGTGTGDAFLARYDASTGAPQWAVRAGGTNRGAFTGVTTDPRGNIYAAGAFDGIQGASAIVAKYSADSALQWTQSSIGTNGAIAFAGPVVDAEGNCYVAGWFRSSAVFGATTLSGDGYWNYFLAKLTPLALGIGWSNSLPCLSVTGEAGIRFALEYVPTLARTNNWQPLFTNILTTIPFIYKDGSSSGSPTRFYQARVVP